MIAKLIKFACLLSILTCELWGQANGPAPQNQPPGQIPLLVGGQFNSPTPAAIAPGNMTPLQLDSLGNLKVNLQAGSITGAGTSATDSSGFTAGVSIFTPHGGVFNDALTAISPGVWATFRMTAFRAQHVNLRDSFGNEYSVNNPFPVNISNTITATLNYTTGNPLPVTTGGKFYVYPMGENKFEPLYVQNNASQPLWIQTNPALPLPVTVVSQAGGAGTAVTVTNTPNVSVTNTPNVSVTNTAAENLTQIAGTAVVTVAAGVQEHGIVDSHANNVVACNNWTPFSLTASGQVITGAASKQTYICSINLVTATAQNIALVEGTVTTCGTGTAGMAGGSTAATGWNFAANGGIAQGSGIGAIARTATLADNVCLLLSSTGQTSGVISWTQF